MLLPLSPFALEKLVSRTSWAAFHEGVYIYTVNRYWVSPTFIGSRYCMPMAFTTRSPLAQCLEYTVIYDVAYKNKQTTKLRFELSTDSSIRHAERARVMCASLVSRAVTMRQAFIMTRLICTGKLTRSRSLMSPCCKAVRL